MKVLLEKRMELSRTVASPSDSLGVETKHQRRDFGQSIEDEDQLFLFKEVDILEDLMTHMKQECCRVARGAMKFLKERHERMALTVFPLAGVEEI